MENQSDLLELIDIFDKAIEILEKLKKQKEAPKLKPCPFCGNEEIKHRNSAEGDYELEFKNYYECKRCEARTNDCYNEDEAIKAWNTRVGVKDAEK